MFKLNEYPIYYGKVFLEKHKDEEAHFVDGQYEALISEELFNRVQEVLDGKRRLQRPNTKILSGEHFPLRVFWYALNVEKILLQALQKGEITDTTMIIAMQPVDSAIEQNWSIQFLKKD